MIHLLTTTLRSRQGNSHAWVAAAIILGVAIIVAMIIYTQSQTHPFWEVT